jgi:hypothetical protein
MTNTPAGWDDILADGETILWQGRPDSGIIWSSLLSFETVFGLFFAGFAAFWIAGARAMTGTTGAGGIDGVFAFFPLFGLPFLLVGLYLAVGRIFWDAYSRGRTWYTLTNRAAYIARDVMAKRSLKRYPFNEMRTPELQDDARGSVFFAEELRLHTHRNRSRNGFSGATRTSTQRIPIGFRRIDDARAVYRLIVEHRSRAPQAAQERRCGLRHDQHARALFCPALLPRPCWRGAARLHRADVEPLSLSRPYAAQGAACERRPPSRQHRARGARSVVRRRAGPGPGPGVPVRATNGGGTGGELAGRIAGAKRADRITDPSPCRRNRRARACLCRGCGSVGRLLDCQRCG